MMTWHSLRTADQDQNITNSTVMAIFIEPAPYITRLSEELDKQWPAQVSTWFIASAVSQNWQKALSGSTFRVLPPRTCPALATICREMCKQRPGIVFVAGWSHPLIVAAIIMARLLGAKVVSMSDTWVSHSRGLRAGVKRSVLALIHRFCPGGLRQSQYLRELRIPAQQIIPGKMTVDTAAIDAFMTSQGKRRRTEVRDRLGIPDDSLVFLFVGRLEPVKAPDLAISAFSAKPRNPKARLIVVGDGSLSEKVLAATARDDRIIYLGRLQGNELLAQFAAADALIAPSRSEAWGLAINEALAAGLAVILSDCFGCIDDLVIPETNGLVVPTDDVASLQTAIATLSENPELLAKFRLNAKRTIDGWTVEAWAKNIILAWRDVLQ